MPITNTGAAVELNLELALAAMNTDDVSLSELKDSIRDLFVDCRQTINNDKENGLSMITARCTDGVIIKFDIYANDTVKASVTRKYTPADRCSIARFGSVWSDDGAVFIAATVMFDANRVADGEIDIIIRGNYNKSLPQFTSLRVDSGIYQFDGASGDRDCQQIIEHCQNLIKAKHGLLEVDTNSPF